MSLKSTLKDFKDFAVKGNVIDMAVGVIIGGAFSGIVSSLVNDIINPVIGVLTGGLDFSTLFIPLDGNTYASLDAALEANAAVLKYGSFISTVINFLIISFVIFIVIRQLSKLKKPAPAPVSEPSVKICPYCKTEIHIDAVRCPNCTSKLD